jgi:glycopeptide antibiotics resistance protein
MLVFAVGAIVAITLTPGHGDGDFGRASCGGLDPVPRLSQLVSLSSEHGLNVVLFVPLGLLIGLIPRARPFAVAALAAIAMPIVIEWIQYSVPRLDRICQTWDALENLSGLAIGVGIGVAIAVVRRSARRAA